MEKVNLLRIHDNGNVKIIDYGIDKNNNHFETEIVGKLKSVSENCLYLTDRSIPLIGVKRAVKTIFLENGTVIYNNPYIDSKYNAKFIEEVFDEHVKMFGKEETLAMYKKKVEEIKEHNPDLAQSYVEKLNIR